MTLTQIARSLVVVNVLIVCRGGGTTFPDPTGASMDLTDQGIDNGSGVNWCVSTTSHGYSDLGSPGGVNERCT